MASFYYRDQNAVSGLSCWADNFSNCLLISKKEDQFEWESILTKHSGLGSKIMLSHVSFSPGECHQYGFYELKGKGHFYLTSVVPSVPTRLLPLEADGAPSTPPATVSAPFNGYSKL